MNQQEESVENIFSDSLKLPVGQGLSETANDQLTAALKVPYAAPDHKPSLPLRPLRLCRKEGKLCADK